MSYLGIQREGRGSIIAALAGTRYKSFKKAIIINSTLPILVPKRGHSRMENAPR